MLSRLIESGAGATARRQWLPSGLIAVAAHAVIVAGAALATLEPAPAVGADQSAVIIAWPVETARDRRGEARDEIAGLPEPIVDVAPVPPFGLPPIATGGRIEPFLPVRDVAGTGPVNDGPAAPADWLSVDEPPALLAGPPPVYPELLRAAGIRGRVVLQVVVDTLGRAERAVTVVESSNRGFDAAALAYVREARFRPGRVRSRAVRVLIRLPIDFTLRGAP